MQNAISTALAETSVPNTGATDNALIAWADPMTEVLSLSFSSHINGSALVEIYSADGKLVKASGSNGVSAGLNRIEMGTAELSAGLYSVIVILGDRVMRTRIIIE